MKKIVYFALQASISIFLINLVFDEVSNHGLELVFADKFLLDFFQAIFLFLLGLLLQTWRLSLFVSMYNQKISKFLLFTAQYLGMFFSLVLPSSIGGDIVKVLILKNGLKGFTRATIPIVLDRIVGLLSITFFIPLYFLILKDFSFNLILLYLVFGILLMVGSVFFIFLLYQKFYKKYWSKWGKFLPSNVKFLDILIILTMSLVSQILIFVSLWVASRSINFHSNLFDFVGASSAAITLSSIPISIGGWGMRELIFANMMEALNYSYGLAIQAGFVLGLLPLMACSPSLLLLLFIEKIAGDKNTEANKDRIEK